jgi:hypothetical protein
VAGGVWAAIVLIAWRTEWLFDDRQKALLRSSVAGAAAALRQRSNRC